MSLGAKQKSTTTTTAPWAPQQPFLQNLFSRADDLYKSQGTPNMGLLNSAAQQAQNTISGKYLDPQSNPYFSGALSNVMGDVKSAVNANFQGDNFGSSAHQEWLGKQLTNAALPMLANQYNMERGNQMAATAQAPGLNAAQINLPWMPLQNYQQAVGGTYGSQQTQPYFQNDLASLAGLGIGGLSLFGVGGPFAAGGAFGGLLGK